MQSENWEGGGEQIPTVQYVLNKTTYCTMHKRPDTDHRLADGDDFLEV